MSVHLLALSEAQTELETLHHYLTNLPTTLPNSSEVYTFEKFMWDPKKAEEFGGIDSAVNHALEIIF
jgi:hypothetical protein